MLASGLLIPRPPSTGFCLARRNPKLMSVGWLSCMLTTCLRDINVGSGLRHLQCEPTFFPLPAQSKHRTHHLLRVLFVDGMAQTIPKPREVDPSLCCMLHERSGGDFQVLAQLIQREPHFNRKPRIDTNVNPGLAASTSSMDSSVV